MATNNSALQERMRLSAEDFIRGVQPAFEKRLRARVLPTEHFDSSELAWRLDLGGVDAFYYSEMGIGEVRALGSRIRYESSAAREPSFTLRYARWNEKRNDWDTNGEFVRKTNAIRNLKELIVCPKLHIESFSQAKGSGRVTWSFAVETEHLLAYIHEHFDNEALVSLREPPTGERRKYLSVPVESFARQYPVIELGSIQNYRKSA